jgi:hypothetical protein
MRQNTRYIFLGQVSLFLFLFVCLLLNPHFLLEANEGGVSNYGLHLKTVVPYTLAFGLAGILTIFGARGIPSRTLRIALRKLGALFLAVLLTTYFYKFNHSLDNIHEYVSAALFFAELGLGTWFTISIGHSPATITALGIQYFGFILGILNYVGAIHKLFIAEIVASLGFSALLVMTVDKVQRQGK